MQGIKKLLNCLFSERLKKQRDSFIGISLMALFVVASTLVNRAIFAANNSDYGYGYSSNSYDYGYGLSDAVPAAPTGFVCSSTSSTAVQCSWNIVNTTTSGTAISSTEFGSYKLYRSTTSPASSSDTLVATVSSQSTLTASDSSLTAGTTYYYALYALDSNTNTSSAVLASVTPGGTSGGGGGSSSGGGSGSSSGTTTSTNPATSTTATSTTSTTTTTTTTTLSGEAQIAQITSEASTVTAMGSEGLADLVGVERSLTTEKAAVSLLGKAQLSVTTETIAFVSYGTPSSVHLGSGERAGVLGSYIGAFKSFPQTAEQWADLLKIANGRWPSQRSTTAESKANSQFEKIYLRKAVRSNAHDDAAVMIMGYGLRPGPKQRNLDSERRAITIYRGIFKTSPVSSVEWDTARAIGYSGATR